MVGNFLQEVMEPVDKDAIHSFSRVSYLNYNRTNLRWVYIVLDTRYPIMMFETSVDHQASKDNSIHLYLDNFVVPSFWGLEFAGMLAKVRRVFQFGNDTNINRQYWTLPGGKEFLAIEYIYRRE